MMEPERVRRRAVLANGSDEALARQREQPRRDVRPVAGGREVGDRAAARTPSRPPTPAPACVARRARGCRVAPRSTPGWKPAARDAPRLRVPDSRTIAANCSAKSGFPSAVDRDRARGSRRRRRRATRSARPSRRPRAGRARRAGTCAQVGRASSRSGRALQSSTIGPTPNATTYSRRSSIVGSAQWMSSRQTSSGRSCGEALEHSPDAPEELVARCDERRLSDCRAKSLERGGGVVGAARSSSATASRPPRSRTSSTSGQYVIPAPYARQRPETTRALDSKDAATSRASRDFPTPAGPMSVSTPHRSSAKTRSIWARIVASSATRPTSGASSLRA